MSCSTSTARRNICSRLILRINGPLMPPSLPRFAPLSINLQCGFFTASKCAKDGAPTELVVLAGINNFGHPPVYFPVRRAPGLRRLVALGLTVVALEILAFAATISYDCWIKSFISPQGRTSNRSSDTHL
jgi:hypothetical protein